MRTTPVTTLLLKNLKSYKPALIAVDRWGKATGMRENKKKREGLAMGKYREDGERQKLPKDTKWVEEGDWAKSLGNPIGNDLEGGKNFIEKKLEAVRSKSKKWFGLYTAKYQGRNLITQAMYFGSLRY